MPNTLGGFVNQALKELAINNRRNSSSLGPNPTAVKADSLTRKQSIKNQAPLLRPNSYSVNKHGTLSQSMIAER